MTKYQVGDKVVVRSDLQEDEQYSMINDSYTDIAVDEMVERAGKTVTIAAIEPEAGHMSYSILEDSGYWSWTDEMFELNAK
ncbi:hypothetical protein BSK59_15985 [Paenibacillus odorifer]|uniref:hypothetical protein n=1 Tax=Paenibacillus odorifer TaxID=189426 RepID=UPI0009700DAB|nr:hypothetical protein [Paenibacillus odorifer]OME54080.1 hypothetical protein BSK59_15985 [Paenibacillus odorifer]